MESVDLRNGFRKLVAREMLRRDSNGSYTITNEGWDWSVGATPRNRQLGVVRPQRRSRQSGIIGTRAAL